MKTDEKFINGLSQIMKSVTPKKLFRDYKLYPENRDTLFDIVCSKACLNKKSFDVMQAFEQCFKQ